MTEAHNAHAGQGAVLLDIGGDIGALVVQMPTDLEGVEIEIRPTDRTEHLHEHEHPHDHEHEHPHDHEHAHDHSHGSAHATEPHHPHVAVVARPAGAQMLPSLVFGELTAGEYELYERLGGPVRLTATVRGGSVTEAMWPT